MKTMSAITQNTIIDCVKILIVDDHDLIRTGLARILSEVREFNVIGEASSGEQSLKMARELAPDIVLMDIKMPGILDHREGDVIAGFA